MTDDWNAGVRAAALVVDNIGWDQHASLTDVAKAIRALLRPATGSAPEAMRRVLGVARTHLAAHQYEYAPGFCNACIPVLADIDAALVLPREDGETCRYCAQGIPLEGSEHVGFEPDPFRPNEKIGFRLQCQAPRTPATDHSALAKRLRRAYQTACNDDYSKPDTLMRARHVERLTAIEDAASALDAARAGEET